MVKASTKTYRICHNIVNTAILNRLTILHRKRNAKFGDFGIFRPKKIGDLGISNNHDHFSIIIKDYRGERVSREMIRGRVSISV